MMLLNITIFISSVALLFFSGSKLVRALMRIGRFLGWREFVVAFFIMAIAGTVPNLFVGINSALKGIPELSFGEIMGGNVLDLTLAVGLAVIIGKGSLSAGSRMVQSSAVFTVGIALLPILLILDGRLGRIDGGVLLLAFAFYTYWLFSKEERFKQLYDGQEEKRPIKKFSTFLKDLWRVVLFLALLLLASEGIVASAQNFSAFLGIGISTVGILIVGVGNALPETYFAVASARRGQGWMILGDLMGSVIACTTLVLGVVALIQPFVIENFSPFATARMFLIISALFFWFSVKTNHEISKKEGLMLILIYIIFVVLETILS
jgi:cation:H+ antiporter